MAVFRDQAAAMLGETHPEFYSMVVVPDDPARIGPQPQTRRQAHIELLYELSIRTLASGDALEPLPGKADGCGIREPLPILAHLCAVCRGACCHLGKEHAFLDVTAIRRFVSRSGLTDPLHIVYAYAARLPEIAVIDGCMYQAHWGCALPRWMRAGICNSYRCKGLKQAEQMIQQSATNRICVMVRENNRISRAAFVQPHRIRHYPACLVETGDTRPTAP